MLSPEAGEERFVVEIPHTEEGGDGQQRVREDLLPLPAPELRVAGVEVDQLGPGGGGRHTTAYRDELEEEASVGVDVLTVVYYHCSYYEVISSRNIQQR